MDVDVEMMSRYQPKPMVGCNGTPDGRCQVMLTSFLYCVSIPVAAMTVFLVLLIILMCCARRACECKKYSSLTSDTNDIQMESYNTIRRASTSLRYMSHGGSGMGSRTGSSATLDRSSYRRGRRGREASHSAPGTLQRQHRNRHSVLEDQTQSPPPPPPYSMHSDDFAFGSGFLHGADMQTSVQSDFNPERNGNGAQPLLHRYQHH